MDINNNQQINTFTKGMNTDTSDAFIGADQYRYAENLRISTDTNSSGGTLVPIGGTVKIDSTTCDWNNIIAVTSARDILVVVGIKIVNDLNYMQVYEYNTTGSDLLGLSPNSWRKMLIEGDSSHGMLLGNDSSVPSHVSTVVRWESDKNVKLYIADGVHTIMAVNLDRTTDLETAESGTPNVGVLLLPPQVEIVGDETGNINAAKVQYAYRFYTEGGNATISPISEQLIFYKDDSHGYTINENSAKAVLITIPQESIDAATDSNNTINALQIYRISYLITGHEPKIDQIYNGPLQNQFTDRGNPQSEVTITVEEFMAFEHSQTIPHEIENKGDYLFLANLSYVKDGVDNKFKTIDTKAPSSGGNEAFKTYEWNPEHWKNPVNPENFGGQGEYFKWEYDKKSVTLTANNEIVSGDDITSLRRGEVYRYGVILYDEYGHASSPKFVADIMIPPESEPGFELVTEFNNGQTTLNRIGIKFSVVKDLSEFGVGGWEIVRCNRSYSDKINIFQGIAGLAQRMYKDSRDDFSHWRGESLTDTTHFSNLKSETRLYPGGFLSMQYYKDAWNAIGNTTYSDPGTLMFACPEFCYMSDDASNQLSYMKQNLAFQPVQYYNIPVYNNNGLVSAGSSTGKTVSSFRLVNDTQCFGNTTSRIKPDNDKNQSLWLEAWGPEGADPENMVEFSDCTEIRYADNLDCIQYIAFYHIQPNSIYSINEQTVTPKPLAYIDAYSTVEVSDDQYKSFSRQDQLSFMNDTSIIKSDQFINWVASGIDYLGYQGQLRNEIQEALSRTWHTLYDGESQHGFIIPYTTPGLVRYAATGGKCLLFSAKDDQGFGYFSSGDENIFPICIGNIRNTHPVPYGGYSEQSKINSVYYGDGNFTTGSELSVFDGDTYLCMFTYNAAHGFIDAKYWNIPKLAVVYTVPIESSINLKARSGYLYMDKTPHDDLDVFVQDHPVSIEQFSNYSAYVQTDYAYVYNAAYDALPSVVKYIPVYYNSIQTNNYDNRIHFTAAKENGELIDKWLQTDSNSYIDVDSKFGAITNLRLFKDRLMFWQEHAVGLLTVDEKTVITNDKGSDIILADNSGVVKRYDYISTKYGMKKGQHTDAQSDNALYWWDSDNKELLQYSGNGLVPLTKAHMVENYINERKESVKPHVGYYGDFDEIFANVRKSDGNNGESLVFNEKLNAFTAVYKFDPIYSTSIGNALYLAKLGNVDNDAAMYRMSASDISSNTVLFDSPVYPLVQYVVNNQSSFVKVFDIQTLGGNFYGGGGHGERSTNQENVPELRNYPRVTLNGNDTSSLQPLTLSYTTPLRQSASVSGDRMTNREYDFRLDIPRNGDSQDWGDRLRGKTMQCTIKSDSNSKNFSLQYVITKYRMSWS